MNNITQGYDISSPIFQCKLEVSLSEAEISSWLYRDSGMHINYNTETRAFPHSVIPGMLTNGSSEKRTRALQGMPDLGPLSSLKLYT